MIAHSSPLPEGFCGNRMPLFLVLSVLLPAQKLARQGIIIWMGLLGEVQCQSAFVYKLAVAVACTNKLWQFAAAAMA